TRIKTMHAGKQGRQPQRSMRIFRDGTLVVRAQLALPIDLKSLRLRIERVESVLGSHPQPAALVDEESEHGILTQASSIARIVPIGFPLSRQYIELMQASAPRAEPELA